MCFRSHSGPPPEANAIRDVRSCGFMSLEREMFSNDMKSTISHRHAQGEREATHQGMFL